jgi:ABC-type sugar transport system permease subunit
VLEVVELERVPRSTDILATYLYQQGFQILNFGLASALAVVVLVILLILSLAYVHLLIHRTRVG